MSDAWLRRIERIHCIGMITAACLIGTVASMMLWPDAFWTRLIPVLETTPVDHHYSLDDVRHWTEARAVIPVRQAKLKQLRQELTHQTAALDDWVLKASTDAAADKKQLRSVAESFHEQATRFGMTVELIRIKKSESRSENPSPDSDASMELQWCPMTLRMEGTYAQACRFLHHSAERLPAMCRRLTWTRISANSDRDARQQNVHREPRFQLELEIAIAIIQDEPAAQVDSAQDDSVEDKSDEGNMA
ncbi:hypothetical protein [Neorhodopirellula pilleata]|uniref:Pilus assembly protein, PilO n=1 Tax=Neorhodopirellula pilleata TaxID=2714738 RepID=A0A5C6A7X9_9BACT|nr:hypothetical protein [Neorhodopirellula pilleata]TWT95629.1 hypothetical protein Pla100_32700 [Neorhodopirellula pilleata]